MKAIDLLKRSVEHLRCGRMREALDVCDQILQAEPTYAQATYHRGILAYLLANYEEAASWFRLTLALGVQDAALFNNLGEAYRSLGRLNDAAACYREGLRRGPGMAQLHNNLGLVCLAQGRLSEALAYFTAATRIQPEYAKAHRNLGRTLQDMGRASEALTCFDRAQSCEQWPQNAARQSMKRPSEAKTPESVS